MFHVEHLEHLTRPTRPTLRAIAQAQGWLSFLRGVRLTAFQVARNGLPAVLGMGILGIGYYEPDRDEAVYFLRPLAFFVRVGLGAWWHAIDWLWHAGLLDTDEGERVKWHHLRLRWWRVWMARAVRWKDKDYQSGFESGRRTERQAWAKALSQPPPTSASR